MDREIYLEVYARMNEKSATVTNAARGTMIDHAASRIYVRDFPSLVADEKSAAGGQDRGPTPLEYILVGLCA